MASEAFVLPPWGFQSSQGTKKTPLHLYIHNSPLMHFEMPLNLNVSQHKIYYYAIGEENGGTSPRHHKYKAVVFLGLQSTKVAQSLAFSFLCKNLIYFGLL